MTLDRRAGHAFRAEVARRSGGPAAARAAAGALSPTFRGMVLFLLLAPRTRPTGLRALGAGVGAGLAARALRDRLGRPRPGRRSEGGLPSRHAASAVAIVRAVGRGRPALGGVLLVAAVLGLAGRVASGEHDPGDIVAGAALGWGVDAVLERLAGGRR
jgi:membrane-associated phospholipid phosphatase